jgi:hypothetical protein
MSTHVDKEAFGIAGQFAWRRRAVKPQSRVAAHQGAGLDGEGADQAMIGTAVMPVIIGLFL